MSELNFHTVLVSLLYMLTLHAFKNSRANTSVFFLSFPIKYHQCAEL